MGRLARTGKWFASLVLANYPGNKMTEYSPMNQDPARRFVRSLESEMQLIAYANWLNVRLFDQTTQREDRVRFVSESVAEALLLASKLIDTQVIFDFRRLIENETAVRVFIYDLLNKSGLNKDHDNMSHQHSTETNSNASAPWIALVIASFAWQSGYSLDQLDTSAPPTPHSPAGQVISRAAQFIRLQVRYSPTERRKMSRQLSKSEGSVPTIDELSSSDQPIMPLPPHFRPPIPERYPEIARETLRINPDDSTLNASSNINLPLIISDDDLSTEGVPVTGPRRMPAITISQDQIAPEPSAPPSPLPNSGVIMPNSTAQSRSGFTLSLRKMLGHEQLVTTKLTVYAQRFPDGPGLFGLQVRVFCKGIKSHVAGTTNRQGVFVCELPVRAHSGLTYDVDVTWPREEGGETERKSITLHSDRTQFALPFYRSLDHSANSSVPNTE